MADLALRERIYRERVAAMRQAGIGISEKDLEVWFAWVRFLDARVPALAQKGGPMEVDAHERQQFGEAIKAFVADHPMLPIVQQRLMRAEQLYDLIINLPGAAIAN